MDPISLNRQERLSELRLKYPMMPDQVLARAPIQITLGKSGKKNSHKLAAFSRAQVEKLEAKERERREKDKGEKLMA